MRGIHSVSGQGERTLRMFFFSGTGNARNVARRMVEVWRERNHAAEAVGLANVDVDRIEVGPYDDIGLASPTHGFNFPPITLAFLFAFPRQLRTSKV